MRRRKIDPKHIIYGPICDVKGYDNVRWVEHVSDGLRFVGYADEICRLRHTGWFTHDDGDPDETLRGAVYRLPARNGLSMYVYGHADPNNDDCAFLVMGTPALEKEDAARWADQFAERMAEEQRDFHRAWDAGRRYDRLGEEIVEMRREALKLCDEMHLMKRQARYPKSYATLRARVFELYRDIQAARNERADLLSTFGRESGWEE
jgi:hypothetical protein